MAERAAHVVNFRASQGLQTALGRRVKQMMLLWLFFGALVGAAIGFPKGGLLPIICNVMSGMILMPFLGLFLGLIGGQVRLSLVGGICGVLLGAITALLSSAADPFSVMSVALIGGALAGATVSTATSWTGFLIRAAAAPGPS